jgi:SAM-dependent methyltransferase
MNSSLEQLKQTWTQLGQEDPMWAVVSHRGKRQGKWDVEEFFQTGENYVLHYHTILREHGGPERFNRVLDFGCGLGRLTQAWARRAETVVGVDISPPMIHSARRLAAALANVEFVLNDQTSLVDFPNDRFELVASHICLQHMPWALARQYLAEFARVCRPAGWVAFQLPASHRHQTRSRVALARKWLVDHLPWGLGSAYRRWKHGTSVIFEMYYTPSEEVVRAAAAIGLIEIHRRPDDAAGPGSLSYTYLFQKKN